MQVESRCTQYCVVIYYEHIVVKYSKRAADFRYFAQRQ